MNIFIEIIATIIDVLFLIWFVPKFNGVSLKNKPKSLCWAAILLIFQLIADRFFHDAAVLYALYVIIDLLLALCFSLSLQSPKRLWHTFAAFVYVIVIMLSSTFVYTILALFVDDVEAILQVGNLYVRIIYLLGCKIAHLVFYKLILMIFKKDKNLDLKNSVLSLLFTVMTALGLGILMIISVIGDFNGMEFLVVILSLVLISLNVILYAMIHQVQGLLKSKYELSLINERIYSERSRIEDAYTIWENIRKLKHDLKNHFTVLLGKLGEDDTESCKKYISELNRTVESMGNLIKSGNSVIDYLINTKLSNIENTQVLISGYVGNYTDVEEVDLACILGNIIDNAIEAQTKVSKEKRIELHFLQKNSSRVIICKNAISESVLQKNKSLESTKESPHLHGLGHQIVESAVQKYNGMINYFEEEGMFGVQIVLPIENK